MKGVSLFIFSKQPQSEMSSRRFQRGDFGKSLRLTTAAASIDREETNDNISYDVAEEKISFNSGKYSPVQHLVDSRTIYSILSYLDDEGQIVILKRGAHKVQKKSAIEISSLPEESPVVAYVSEHKPSA